MTNLKQIFIASAATIAFATTPALAGEKMHKDHSVKTQVSATHDAVTKLSPAERMAWETKVKARMSSEKQAKWASFPEEKRAMWMNKKIAKMMSAEATGSAPQMAKNVSYDSSVSTLRNDTIGEILQADGDADPETDRKLLMSNGDQMSKAKLIMSESDNRASNNAIVVPTVDSNVLTTVSCPVGTTAQPDMTCMVTGNYNPTS